MKDDLQYVLGKLDEATLVRGALVEAAKGSDNSYQTIYNLRRLKKASEHTVRRLAKYFRQQEKKPARVAFNDASQFTLAENMRRHFKAKYGLWRVAAAHFGVTQATISNVATGYQKPNAAMLDDAGLNAQGEKA